MQLQTVPRRAFGLLLTAAMPLAGQVSAAAGLGAVVQRQDAGLWQSATRIDPAFRLDSRWAQLAADAWVRGSSTGMRGIRLDRGSLNALAVSPTFGPFAISTNAHVDRLTTPSGFGRTVGTVESALSFRQGNTGAWLGMALEHAREIDTADVQPLPRAGIWRQFSRVTLSLGTEGHNARFGGRPSTLHLVTYPDSSRDTLGGGWTYFDNHKTKGDSGSPSRLSRWSDVQGRIGWSGDRVSLDARIGLRPKLDVAPPAMWGSVTATMDLASHLALIASGGTEATRIWAGMPASRFALLGLRLSPAALVRPAPPPHVRPAAASFALRPAGADTYVVTLRVPDARSVELSGDFNGWHAVTLRQVRPDLWETMLTLGPGTYHVNMRVNGDTWTAPPGLAAARDEFNGTVGLLLVR